MEANFDQNVIFRISPTLVQPASSLPSLEHRKALEAEVMEAHLMGYGLLVSSASTSTSALYLCSLSLLRLSTVSLRVALTSSSHIHSHQTDTFSNLIDSTG